MDSPLSPRDAQPDEHLSALVNEFFDRRQAGERLTAERFATEHPQVAAELKGCLAGLPLIDLACGTGDGLAEAARTSIPAPAVPGYDILAEIGRGGMGVVYKALQQATKRVVALKVMLAAGFASPAARRRFQREVELAARLTHPHIVRVLESGHVAGQQYYAMDHVTGERLDRYVVVVQPDIRALVGLFATVADAVDYAHTHGVVHRDLKPGNVLIDEQGEPHILDFGLAKALDDRDAEESAATRVSLTGQVLGTLAYLSPEQAAGTLDEIDGRTDVYALGVTLFEVLTGRLPIDATGRPSQVVQRIQETPPTAPSTLSSSVDRELETIILKALEKDRTRRYQSARELAEDLRRYLAGEPILARRPSTAYVLGKRLRRHRAACATALTAVVLAGVAVVGAVWWRHYDRARGRWDVLQRFQAIESGVGFALGPEQSAYARYHMLPEARLMYAHALYRGGEANSAIRFLEGQLQTDAAQWSLRTLLADMYRAGGATDRAEQLREQVAREAPDTAEAWYLRSLATLDLSAALGCAERAVAQDAAHHLARWRAAELRMKVGDFAGALQEIDALIVREGDSAQAALFRGHVLLRQGRDEDAVAQYTHAAAFAPRQSSAYSYRAHARRLAGDYAGAAADYSRVLRMQGEATPSAWDLFHRAPTLWILGRTEEALADYRRVRVLLGRPSHANARAVLMLRELGRRGEADELLADALRGAQDPWLRQILRCLVGELSPDGLIAAADAETREHICEAYYYAGEVHRAQGDAAGARECFQRAIQTGVRLDLNAYPFAPMSEYELARWRLATLPTTIPTSLPEK